MSGPQVRALILGTLAFCVCFAGWTLNGVLAPFLVQSGAHAFDRSQLGWLLGLPIVTGALLRLPVGVLCDRFGAGRVLVGVLLAGATSLFTLSFADGDAAFYAASLAMGISGASFAAGVAYVSAMFPGGRAGTALGPFGFGILGAALTGFAAPALLRACTAGDLEGWRTVPRLYALALAATAALFRFFAPAAPAPSGSGATLRARLAPLGDLRVWRYGLEYLLAFGGFVGLAQWIVPYGVGNYGLEVQDAARLSLAFSLPSAMVRPIGGWLSDRIGARRVLVACFSIVAAGCTVLALPVAGDLAVFTATLIAIGMAMGAAMAAVFQQIPHAFPGAVGVTGGFVGVIGGLGGFAFPTVFGALVGESGSWASTWIALGAMALACVVGAARGRYASASPVGVPAASRSA
jgi:NNP family nitrate/nitrite transporter-like MFS transporter